MGLKETGDRVAKMEKGRPRGEKEGICHPSRSHGPEMGVPSWELTLSSSLLCRTKQGEATTCSQSGLRGTKGWSGGGELSRGEGDRWDCPSGLPDTLKPLTQACQTARLVPASAELGCFQGCVASTTMAWGRGVGGR